MSDGLIRGMARLTAKWVGNMLIVVFLVALYSGIGAAGLFWYAYTHIIPEVHREDVLGLAQTSRIYDRSGQYVLYELYGEEDRTIVGSGDIPETIKMATVSAEDERFYKHFGVDPVSLARAARENYHSGGASQGGSTITMQLARNIYLSREKTLERKFTEALLAIKLEHIFTKDEILYWYLNIVPYGSNTYGIESAAQTYFGKGAKDLTLDEAAFLAAIPKATTHYSPYGENAKDLRARQRWILQKVAQNYPDKIDVVRRALATDTFAKVHPRAQSIRAPHFVMHVLDELRGMFGDDLLRVGGLNIRTTIDMTLQGYAEDSVREGVEKNVQYNASNAALAAIDPENGEVLAMVGSKDYFDTSIDGQVNVATRPRQPGSAFKPIAYAKAFELGLDPNTPIYDVTTDFGPDGSGGDYIPHNYDGRSHGLTTMGGALAMSLNVPAVKTLYAAGLDNVLELASRLGITTLNDRDRYGLSLVLGGGEITLLEGTAAYGVFANGGTLAETHSVEYVETKDGRRIFSASGKNDRVLPESVAGEINSVLSNDSLRAPTFGKGSKLTIPGVEVAAKTGTTQEYRDAWTIGYTPSLVAGVWAGNNDNTVMRPGAAGIFAAAPIWNDFMQKALAYEGTQESFPLAPTVAGVETTRDEEDRDAATDKKRSSVDSANGSLIRRIQNSNLRENFPAYSSDMISRWDAAIGRGTEGRVKSEEGEKKEKKNKK